MKNILLVVIVALLTTRLYADGIYKIEKNSNKTDLSYVLYECDNDETSYIGRLYYKKYEYGNDILTIDSDEKIATDIQIFNKKNSVPNEYSAITTDKFFNVLKKSDYFATFESETFPLPLQETGVLKIKYSDGAISTYKYGGIYSAFD